MSAVLKKILKKLDDEYTTIASEGLQGNISYYIDSGCYAFNALVSGSIFRGIPGGKIAGIAGAEACGKSYITLGICENFLQMHPEGIVAYYDSEHAIDEDILRPRCTDLTRISMTSVGTVEEFHISTMQFLEEYGKVEEENRPPLLMVLDSLGQLATNDEIKNSVGGELKGDMGRKAKLIKGAFRTLTMTTGRLGVTMIVTNHTHATMEMYGPKRDMSGGNALKYSASSIVYLSKSKARDEEKKQIGNIIRCQLIKGRKAVEGKEVDLSMTFLNGLEKYSGLLDIALEGGAFTVDGRSIVMPNGVSASRSEIEENPAKYFTEEILKAVDVAAQKIFTYGSKTPTETHVEETEIKKEPRKNAKAKNISMVS
jgi:RecA/RadA recombinase